MNLVLNYNNYINIIFTNKEIKNYFIIIFFLEENEEAYSLIMFF